MTGTAESVGIPALLSPSTVMAARSSGAGLGSSHVDLADVIMLGAGE